MSSHLENMAETNNFWKNSKSEEVVRSFGTRVMDGCELPREYLESKPGPLQEQNVLLTSETSLQSIRVLLIHRLKPIGPRSHELKT
ncbi:mCG1039131, isoform CRA_a [Mus musculus]|nr:mCG1039131, isoform CRA_a [Mus musculus]